MEKCTNFNCSKRLSCIHYIGNGDYWRTKYVFKNNENNCEIYKER